MEGSEGRPRPSGKDGSAGASPPEGTPRRFREGQIGAILSVFLGLAFVWLAQGIGGANVYTDDFAQPAISFGFDYLVLALLVNSAVFLFLFLFIFIFIERLWPLRPAQRTLRPEWRLDLVCYGVNHVMVGVVLLVTPHLRHWHHSADTEAIDRNYAASLPILDRLVGTYLDNADRWPTRYGILGKPLPTGSIAQTLYAFIAHDRLESDA